MYDDDPKLPKTVKTLIFIMVGAMLIMFTDLVLLNGAGTIQSNAQQRLGNYFTQNDQQHASGDISLSIATLRSEHNRYLRQGVDISDRRLSNAIIFPQPLTATATISDKIIADIQPAAGVEGDIREDLRAPQKGNFEDIDDIYSAVYNEQTHPEFLAYNQTPERRDKSALLIDDVVDALYTPSDNKYPESVMTPAHKPVQTHKYISPPHTGKARIAIIIDDMGLTLRSRQVEVLPAPLTLAYLPYAENLPERTAFAASQGHELMVHIPMQAVNDNANGGPRVLTINQSYKERIETLEWGLSQFGGYVGINNHMGSRLTSDPAAMRDVMLYLKKRNLFFVDSRTINSSVAAQIAQETGLPYAERDVFLDHEITAEFLANALNKVEETARKNGYAIAIGHPHKVTIDALKVWIPTLEKKGIELVPVSTIVKRPASYNTAVVAAN